MSIPPIPLPYPLPVFVTNPTALANAMPVFVTNPGSGSGGLDPVIFYNYAGGSATNLPSPAASTYAPITLVSTVNTIQTNQTTDEANIVAIQSDITDLTTDVTNLITEVNSINSDITTIDNQIATLQSTTAPKTNPTFIGTVTVATLSMFNGLDNAQTTVDEIVTSTTLPPIPTDAQLITLKAAQAYIAAAQALCLPLTGGTLTGGLTGTTANFTTSVTTPTLTASTTLTTPQIVLAGNTITSVLTAMPGTPTNNQLLTALAIQNAISGGEGGYLPLGGGTLTGGLTGTTANFATSVTTPLLSLNGTGITSIQTTMPGTPTNNQLLTALAIQNAIGSTSYLPLAGGTLTGALTGTTSNFTTSVTTPKLVLGGSSVTSIQTVMPGSPNDNQLLSALAIKNAISTGSYLPISGGTLTGGLTGTTANFTTLVTTPSFTLNGNTATTIATTLTGATNSQIPTALAVVNAITSGTGAYLPLTGGTITGNLNVYGNENVYGGNVYVGGQLRTGTLLQIAALTGNGVFVNMQYPSSASSNLQWNLNVPDATIGHTMAVLENTPQRITGTFWFTCNTGAPSTSNGTSVTVPYFYCPASGMITVPSFGVQYWNVPRSVFWQYLSTLAIHNTSGTDKSA